MGKINALPDGQPLKAKTAWHGLLEKEGPRFYKPLLPLGTSVTSNDINKRKTSGSQRKTIEAIPSEYSS